MNRWVGLGLLLITVGALALRCPQLALRPMHNDEAVNADKIKGLWDNGRYTYDPNEHHGPTLYYATIPFVWLSGARDYDHLSEGTLRAVCVFFGLALIGLLWLLADGLGRAGVFTAGTLTALSPAMVFYSRYFIHEMLLVCFSLLILAAGWRYTRTRKLSWAAVAGVGFGLIYATKETFVLTVGAVVGALLLTIAWSRWRDQQPLPWRSYLNTRHILVGFGMAAAVSLLFFTSFFTNPSGPIDSLRTYVPWLKRAGGESPHIHPWYFYLQRLAFFQERNGPVWSEGLVLGLAVVGGVAALSRLGLGAIDRSLARFVTFYTILLTAAYSVISYKTPWCLLGFLDGMILLAGVGAVALVHWWRQPLAKGAVTVVLLAAAVHLGWQAWRASYVFAADRRNPYVYAQTVPDLLRLVRQVQALAKVHPDGDQMVVKVMAPDNDYWPLPWYLRQFKRVGWWGRLAADPYAPVMIVGAELRAALDDKSDKAWVMVGYFELRPKTFLELYVKFDLWEKYVNQLPRGSDEARAPDLNRAAILPVTL
jgi:uncharacterized protein (TIGR03663 family)